MKKLSLLLLSGVVLALAGCGNQGGSSDQYDTDTGKTSNPNLERKSVTNDFQGNNVQRPIGSGANDYSTNNPGVIPNQSQPIPNQSQPFDSERTNNVP